MDFKNGVKNIQAAGYNGACIVSGDSQFFIHFDNLRFNLTLE